jgi:hypothetical protein
MQRSLSRLLPLALPCVLMMLPAAPVSAQTAGLAPTVALTAAAFSATPSSGLALIGVNRIGAASGPVVVTFTTLNGTAVAGIDYTASTGSLSWADGDTSPRVFAVPIASSGVGNRSFTVALISASGAGFGTPLSATVDIAAAVTPGAVSLSWSAPTLNTDGTALGNPAGYNIYYGTSATGLTQKISIDNGAVLTYLMSNLSAGTWYFALTAVNASGIESGLSTIVSTII